MSPAQSTGRQAKIAAVAALSIGGLTLAAVPFVPAHAADQSITVQMSVTTGGFAPGNGGNGDGGVPNRISDNGRYVVYAASGPVVPGHVQLRWQIMRRDRVLGVTELISKSSDGMMGDGNSYEPSVSADGQVIAFRSSSTNLVPDDTNGTTDIFVHDVRTGTTTRASVTSAGAQVPTNQVAGDNVVGPPSISADGRWVGFTSRVGGYTADDGPNTHAYLHDRETGTIEVVSRNENGTVIGGHVSTPVTPSANGDFVTFQTLAANTAIQIFVRDRRAGQETTTVVGGREWRDLRQAMTPDARFVVYDTGDDGQVLGDSDTNGKPDVFVYDRVEGSRERVSVSSSGAEGNGTSTHGAISNDGRYVTFLSTATNLVEGDTNNQADVFRHDRQTGETILVNVANDGSQATASTSNPAISGDGQHISFNSYSKLTPVSTKSWQQVFVRDLTGKYPALHARIGKMPSRVDAGATHRISTVDILAGPALEIVWTSPKGKATRQSASVGQDTFTLQAPTKPGTYTVTVSYAGQLLETRTVTVRKPGTKRLPSVATKGKQFKVRTVGVSTGQKVTVAFRPKGTTGGKPVTRNGKAKKNGVVQVKAPQRVGTYQVVVRTGGKVIRKGSVRIR